MSRWIRSILVQIIPHIAAISLIVVCIQLALWQQDRAKEKAALLSQWQTAATIQINNPTELAQAAPYTEVSITGQWDLKRHVLLDNQTRKNHPGVHVFVPFRVAGSDVIYFVNRGWQPWYRVSGEWPDYETQAGIQTIKGRLSPPPSVGFELGEASPLHPDQWPNLMTYFDISRLKAVFGPDVADRVILLDPNDPAHLSRDPWPGVNMGPDRHQAYAFQWLAIASAILIIWIALSYRFYRKRHE